MVPKEVIRCALTTFFLEGDFVTFNWVNRKRTSTKKQYMPRLSILVQYEYKKENYSKFHQITVRYGTVLILVLVLLPVRYWY